MASVPEEGNFHYQSKTGSFHYVKKTGYLVKSPSNRIGRWRKRWFMLVDSVEPGQLTGTPERQIRLEYYIVAPLKIKNLRELPKRKGMIDLRSCIAVVSNDDKLKGYKNVINIVLSSFRVHHLAADSKEDMDDWILAVNEFVFSKTKEAQNYFTRPKIKTSIYTDFLASSYYNRSKDDQFIGSQTIIEDIPVHKSNAESDGEGPPPILMPRNRGSLKRTLSRHAVLTDSRSNLKRTLSRHAMLTDEEKRKSFKRKQASVHEDPEETDGLLHIQLSSWNMTMISRNNIKIGGTICTGDCRKISHALLKNTSGGEEQKVVVKTALRDPTSIMKEGLTIWQLMHPNIVMLIGAVLIDNPKHIVLEYCERGTLLEVVQEHGRVLEKGATKSSQLKPTLLNYCKQVSFGLTYLKSKEIAHGAVKACNVLVTCEDICKISGFGESLGMKSGSCFSSISGIEIEWIAPEAFSSKSYTVASDVWSLGIVLYEIWSLGSHPYQSLQKEQIIPRLEENYRLPPPPGVSKDIYRLMIELWHPDPEKRPAIDSVMTFLVQPEEDLLHMNQLPRSSTQQAHSAHTLGAPVSSGEILYRDLQLTYCGFIEQVEAASPQQESPRRKRASTESCTYIEVNELLYRHQLRKTPSRGNVTEEEDDLYWNDLYWKNSTGTQQQNIEDVSPSQSSQESAVDDNDIYWNDALLPPMTPNLFTENQKTGEDDDSRADNNPSSLETPSLDPSLHTMHTNAISSLWNRTNKSSSEDESEDDYCLPHRGERQRKQASVSKRPSDDCDDQRSPNPITPSKDQCAPTPCLSVTEKELSHSYYNSAAAEMMGNIAQIKDSVHPAWKTLSPPKHDSSQSQTSSHLSKSCIVTYTNLQAMKEEECSAEANDNHKYYNSSAADIQALLSPPVHCPVNLDQNIPQETCDTTTRRRMSSPSLLDQEHPIEPQNEYYYNSSAAILSEDEGNDCEPKELYYNAAALSEQIDQVQEETHEDYPGHCQLTETVSASCEAASPGYYNSSSVELLGDGLKKDQNLEDRACRSKSMPHYYNLDMLDPEILIAEEKVKEQQLQPEPKLNHHYYNLDILLDGKEGTMEDCEKSSELEDSSREDVLELLKVRAQRAKVDLTNAHTYRNLDGNFSRDLREDQSHTQTIVHVTPATGKGRTPWQPNKHHTKHSIKYVPANKETSKRTMGNLQAKADLIRENLENDRALPNRTMREAQSTSHNRENNNRKEGRSGKRPVPSRKPVQLQSNRGHVPVGGGSSPTFNKPSSSISPNYSPRSTPSPSPLFSPSPTPLFSPGPSPLVSPSPSPSPLVSPTPSPLLSPSPSPLFSPGRRSPVDSTTKRPMRNISPGENPAKLSQSNLLKLRKSSKDIREVDLVPNLEHDASATKGVTSDTPSLTENLRGKSVLSEHKLLDKSFSNPNLVRKKNEDVRRSDQKDIKCQLTKVLSNPHTVPPFSSTMVRPSPLPKTAVVAASCSTPAKPPITKKKPLIHASTSTISLGNGRSNGGGSKSPDCSSPRMHKKGLHKSSSEVSTAQWQRQPKKPLLPPIMQRNEQDGNENTGTYLVKESYVAT